MRVTIINNGVKMELYGGFIMNDKVKLEMLIRNLRSLEEFLTDKGKEVNGIYGDFAEGHRSAFSLSARWLKEEIEKIERLK